MPSIIKWEGICQFSGRIPAFWEENYFREKEFTLIDALGNFWGSVQKLNFIPTFQEGDFFPHHWGWGVNLAR